MDGEGMQLSNKVNRDGHWIWTVETKIENRFELARVHVNESRLYCFQMNGYQEKPTFSQIQFQFRF